MYTPPAGLAVALLLAGSYAAPAGDALAIEFDLAPPPCYALPAGDAVALAFSGAYTAPAGDVVPVQFVCDGDVPPPPPPPVPGFVFDGLLSAISTPWERAQTLGTDHTARWQDAPRADAAPALRWQWAQVTDHPLATAWNYTPPVDAVTADRWQWAEPLQADRASSWSVLLPQDNARALRWQWADAQDHALATAYRNLPPKDRASRIAWDAPQPLDAAWAGPWGGGTERKDGAWAIPWGWAEALRQQYVPVPPPVPLPGIPGCYAPPAGDSVVLRFDTPLDAPLGDAVALRFSCGPYRHYILRRTRIMQHTLTVCRLPDRLPIHVSSVSINTDRESWAWSCSLDVVDRASYLSIKPTGAGPQLVEINISGHVWTALIERASERRSAPQNGRATPTRFAASGRSRTAALADPYAVARPYVNPLPTDAAGAAARELEYTPFALSWQVPNWAIPAGAWHYDNEPPMGALLRIARACGAVVRSHPEIEEVQIVPAYPVAPWQWAQQAPSIILDGASVIEMGSEWQPGPQYLGVYVSGESQGVLVNVIRSGSAGSPYAQMIVDPLITAEEPGRGRGLREIADSEHQTREPILMPLLPAPAAPGVILPTELVQVEDPVYGIYVAQAQSVSVSASLTGDGAVTARQTVELARHYPATL